MYPIALGREGNTGSAPQSCGGSGITGVQDLGMSRRLRRGKPGDLLGSQKGSFKGFYGKASDQVENKALRRSQIV